MTPLSTSSRVALAVACLLASLSLVAWRQSRGLEALGGLDAIQNEISLSRAERSELERHIQYLQSYGRVVRDARERLGMRIPGTSEQVLLLGGTP